MRKFLLLFVAAPTLLLGCSFEPAREALDDAPTGRVFGGPSESPLFAPFQGDWHHEDIHDPGDMQRADCKIRLIGDNKIKCIVGH